MCTRVADRLTMNVPQAGKGCITCHHVCFFVHAAQHLINGENVPAAAEIGLLLCYHSLGLEAGRTEPRQVFYMIQIHAFFFQPFPSAIPLCLVCASTIAAGRRGKGRGGGYSDDDNDQGRRRGGGGGGGSGSGGARGEGKGAGEGGVGKRGGKKGKGAKRREKEEAAEREARQEVRPQWMLCVRACVSRACLCPCVCTCVLYGVCVSAVRLALREC